MGHSVGATEFPRQMAAVIFAAVTLTSLKVLVVLFVVKGDIVSNIFGQVQHEFVKLNWQHQVDDHLNDVVICVRYY